MTTPELNLVEAMRAELAAIDPPRRCCRQAETADLDRLESRGLDDAGAQRVVTTGHDQRLPALQFFPQD